MENNKKKNNNSSNSLVFGRWLQTKQSRHLQIFLQNQSSSASVGYFFLVPFKPKLIFLSPAQSRFIVSWSSKPTRPTGSTTTPTESRLSCENTFLSQSQVVPHSKLETVVTFRQLGLKYFRPGCPFLAVDLFQSRNNKLPKLNIKHVALNPSQPKMCGELIWKFFNIIII